MKSCSTAKLYSLHSKILEKYNKIKYLTFLTKENYQNSDSNVFQKSPQEACEKNKPFILSVQLTPPPSLWNSKS